MAEEALQLVSTRDGAVRFQVQGRPRSRHCGIAAVREGALVVRLAAHPVDGAANAELLAVLAAALGLPRRDVALVHGQASRAKWVEVRGLAAPAILERLTRALHSG